ncbi:hypothetical protein FQA39_LY08118 [Lamprigera yunnana]|nr:hypothetical protein FQA39_LY08118 [Lamprigera yunnana]
MAYLIRYGSSRLLTQKICISEELLSDSDDEEDFTFPLSYLQQKLVGEKRRSDTAGTSSSLVECDNIEQVISAQINEERSTNDNDVQKDNIYLQIEDVPTKVRKCKYIGIKIGQDCIHTLLFADDQIPLCFLIETMEILETEEDEDNQELDMVSEMESEEEP